jgi:hypothetical protein
MISQRELRLRREIRALEAFAEELSLVVIADPHRFIAHWGSARFALHSVERELIVLKNELEHLERKTS